MKTLAIAALLLGTSTTFAQDGSANNANYNLAVCIEHHITKNQYKYAFELVSGHRASRLVDEKDLSITRDAVRMINSIPNLSAAAITSIEKTNKISCQAIGALY